MVCEHFKSLCEALHFKQMFYDHNAVKIYSVTCLTHKN